MNSRSILGAWIGYLVTLAVAASVIYVTLVMFDDIIIWHQLKRTGIPCYGTLTSCKVISTNVSRTGTISYVRKITYELDHPETGRHLQGEATIVRDFEIDPKIPLVVSRNDDGRVMAEGEQIRISSAIMCGFGALLMVIWSLILSWHAGAFALGRISASRFQAKVFFRQF